MEKPNKIIVGVMAVVILFAVAWIFHPFRVPQSQKILVHKIENAKTFCEEAKAMSLSIPLLNDSIIQVYSDSLRATLIDLNRTWVIFVQTQEGYEEYTYDMEHLNKYLEELNMRYGVELIFRNVRNNVKKMEEFRQKWEKESKQKYST